MVDRGCSLLLLFVLLTRVNAHFNLRDPMPWNPIDCNVPECRGPCPPVWKTGGGAARNSPASPSRVWRRGEQVVVEWHRNNHEGGFYRRALVPIHLMNSHRAHRRFAFEWGCWSQGRWHCGKQPSCGTDKSSWAYRNRMVVPRVYPDGDYVFAMVWYGGIHWRRKRAYFSDYWTCAFVRIQDGALDVSHKPIFKPGNHYRRDVPRGKCISTSTWIGECGGHPCTRNLVRPNVPGEFSQGKQPGYIYLDDLLKSKGRSGPWKEHLIGNKKVSLFRAGRRSRRRKKEKPNQVSKQHRHQSAKKPTRTRRYVHSIKHRKRSQRHVVKWQEHRKQQERSRRMKWVAYWSAVRRQRGLRRRKHRLKNSPESSSKKRHRVRYSRTYSSRKVAKKPRRPTGSWGMRYSATWWIKRNQWWAWKRFCDKYRSTRWRC